MNRKEVNGPAMPSSEKRERCTRSSRGLGVWPVPSTFKEAG